MKLRSLLIATASLLVASTVSAQTLNEIATKFNEGVAAANAKNFDGSAKLLQEAYDMSKTSTEEGALDTGKKAYAMLGPVYMNNGKMMASQKKFNEAVKEFTKAEEVFTALNDARNASQASGMIAKVYEVNAGILYKDGDLDNALIACQEGLARNPNATDLSLLCAKIKYGKGDTAGALADYAALYEFAKTSPRFEKVAGQVDNALLANAAEAAKTNVDLAEENIAMVLANNPANEIAHMQRVQIYSAAKDYKSVVKYGDEAIEAQTNANNKITLNYIVGAAHQVLGDNDNAVKYYNKVTTGQYAASAKQIVESLTKKP